MTRETLLDDLESILYGELRGAARRQLRRLRPGQTLGTTALVHEAYLKLVGQNGDGWNDRAHLVSVAAIAMRHVLVDYARERSARKRGGGTPAVSLDGREIGLRDPIVDVLAVDQALEALGRRSRRLVRVVELRFFAGLSVEEIADLTDSSERTVKRDWRKARAVLLTLLEPHGGEPAVG